MARATRKTATKAEEKPVELEAAKPDADAEKAQPVEPTESKPEQKSTPAVLAYIGPTVQRFALQQFTTYRGGIPAHITAAAAGIPEIGQLFVPVAKLAEARKRLAQRGSIEARRYAAAIKKLNQTKG